MLVIEKTALLMLQSAIVTAARSLRQTNGESALISTINDRALRQAALIAVQLTAGEVIWPGDEKLIIHQARRVEGPFEILGG